MEAVLEIRSGAVELVYLVLFELLGLNLLLRSVEGITRQVAKRQANETGHVKLVGGKWTEILGRGSTQSGLALKAAFWAVSLVSLLMINFGTNGFTEPGAIMQQSVYMSKTSDVQSQLRFLGNVMKARESNYSIGYYEMWWDLLEACQEQRPQTTTNFRSFCSTSLCRESFLDSEQVLTDEDGLDLTQERQKPDHADNFRCNDGRDAPQVILNSNVRIPPVIDTPDSGGVMEFGEESWTEIFGELDLPYKVFTLEEAFGAEHPLNGWVLTCAYYDIEFERRAKSCIVSQVQEEDDTILMGAPPTAQGQEDLWSPELNNKTDIAPFTFVEFIHVDEELRGTNHTQWMTALNVLTLLNDLPALDYVRHINSVLILGANGAEIEESAKTEISSVAFIGVIILGSAIVLAAFGLLVIVALGRGKSYQDLNLGLEDREVYCLMRNHVDGHCQCKKKAVNHVDIGISPDQKSWGILSDSDPPLDGKIGLKELRRRQVMERSI